MVGTVREIRPGRWELRVPLPKDPLTGERQRLSRTVDADGERDAERKLAALVAEIDAGTPTRSPGTFGDLAEQWMDVKARRWSPGTLREHQRIVRRNLTPLHDIDVAKISTHTLDLLYGQLAARGGACTNRPCPPRPCPKHGARCRKAKCKRPPCDTHKGTCATWVPCAEHPCRHGGPLSAATVNRIHVVVRAALGQAVKWGWIRTNPAEHAEPGEVLEDEIDPPPVADVLRLLASAAEADARLATFLLVSIVTGARRGAVCALRWSDLDLAAGAARFPRVISIGPDGPVERPASRTKRSGRKVALDPYAVAALTAHHDEQFAKAMAAGGVLPADSLVFTDDLLGARAWRPDSTSRKFRMLRDGLNLDDVRLHDLRHFMATALLDAGVNPKVVAQRGGWTKVATMLDRYAHAMPATDRAAADVLGGLIAGR
jgi:integrase